MTDFAHDRKSIRRREKAAKQAQVERADVIRELMSTTSGRSFIWDLLSGCHIFATTFTSDALQSAFAEGERNIGLRILADIMITCPDQYIQAQREANERAATDDRRSASEGRDGDLDGREGRRDDDDYDPFDDNISGGASGRSLGDTRGDYN